MSLSSIRVLWRCPGSMGLFGIPYEMRAGQSPRDLYDVGNVSDWTWLGSPGWWGSLSGPYQKRVAAFLGSLGDLVPEGPGEWSELPVRRSGTVSTFWDRAIRCVMGFIFQCRPGRELYELHNVSEPHHGVRIFELGPLKEVYGVATSIEVVREYTREVLATNLRDDPFNTYDSDWLLRFSDEKGRIRVFSAIKDYRRGFRTEIEYLESVLEAHSYSFHVSDNLTGLVYWRIG